MSSSYEGKHGTVFVYSSDLSGMVQIRDGRHKYGPIYVSGPDLLEFVANWIRSRRIATLEDAPDHELLGISPQDIPEQ